MQEARVASNDGALRLRDVRVRNFRGQVTCVSSLHSEASEVTAVVLLLRGLLAEPPASPGRWVACPCLMHSSQALEEPWAGRWEFPSPLCRGASTRQRMMLACPRGLRYPTAALRAL